MVAETLFQLLSTPLTYWQQPCRQLQVTCHQPVLSSASCYGSHSKYSKQPTHARQGLAPEDLPVPVLLTSCLAAIEVLL